MALTTRERMTLTIAGATYRYPAQREEDFVQLVGYVPARAFQVVNGLLQRPDAEAEMPQVVHRLRRVQEARERQRSGRLDVLKNQH